MATVIQGRSLEEWRRSSKDQADWKATNSGGRAASKDVEAELGTSVVGVANHAEPIAEENEAVRDWLCHAPPDDVELTVEPFVNAQGLVLHTYCLLPATETPKGLVFACHGYGVHASFEFLVAPQAGEEHTMWNTSIFGELLKAGFAVCTLDQQSHGHSDGAHGLRCFFETFDHLPQENIDFLTQVLLKNPKLAGLPTFALGLSMGAATALRMTQMRPDLFQGAVLYSPMISLEEVKKQRVVCCIRNYHFAGVITTLDALIPRVPLIAPAKTDALIQKEFEEDPLNYTEAARIRTAKQFTQLSDVWMLSGGLKDVKVPFITYHSVHDTYTDPLGSAKLMEQASTTDKTYRKVGLDQDIRVEMWHRLIAEPGREQIIQDTLRWLLDRVSGASREASPTLGAEPASA